MNHFVILFVQKMLFVALLLKLSTLTLFISIKTKHQTTLNKENRMEE